MNSYHQDLLLFEELLSYRNERELTEWEVEQFCRLIEKYPHFVERIGKDSQVEAMLQSLTEEEYREMGIVLTAKNIIKFPSNNRETISDQNSQHEVFLKTAAVLIFAFIVVFIYSIELTKTKTHESNHEQDVALVTINDEPEAPLTAQELYEKQIAKIPEIGSMKRPPTKFSNAGHNKTEMINYGREIRPILSEYCFHCHGPDEHSREAKLRLDTPEGMLEKSAIVPGDPSKSEVIARIYIDDPDEIMPPPKSHKTMTKEEKEKVKLWIEQGAKWERHWAYDAPEKAQPPKVSLAEWNQNPIDQFVLSKMESKGLQPNPQADPYVLARRVSFDLTGLPLPLEKIQEYVETKPKEKYSKLVDALMKTEAYGEHRAHYWLDAARFGDTHGLHNDKYREMHLYRDWVIQAFNDNKPYDQFTLEQFAGDLLPNSTMDQKIATGFHRCNVTSNEGGAIDEELLVRYNVDRVATTGTVFMGLTVGCAQCHDHKFDPITQKEFYELFAFFNNTSQRGRDGGAKDTAPSIVVPQGERVTDYNNLEKEYKELNQKVSSIIKSDFPENPNIDLSRYSADQNLMFKFDYDKTSGNQSLTTHHFDKTEQAKLEKGFLWEDDKKFTHALSIDHKKGLSINKPLDVTPEKEMSISFWIMPSSKQKNGFVVKQYDKTGWRVQLTGFKLTFQMLSKDSKHNNLYLVSKKALNRNKWNHVVITYRGDKTDESVNMYFDGNKIDLTRNAKYSKIDGSLKTEAPLIIGEGFVNTKLAGFKIENRTINSIEAKIISNLRNIEVHLKRPIAKLKAQEQKLLKQVYHIQYTDGFEKNLLLMDDVKYKKDLIYNSFPTALVMNEKEKPAMANILDRGEYDKKKEEVQPGVPSFLGGWKKEYPQNRLGLAKWIISKENPLTARVTVNRLWQEFFGHGLVKSADDFGLMGSSPSHPKLLDWLAIEFIESGWDIKHMVKLIVSSKTYQQSSQFKDHHHKLDPDNQFLARGPRFRLRAEALRDQALAISGLLTQKVGGKSVKPYQPAGLWKALFNRSFVQDKGENLYRRSLYTFWKRTVAPPSMVIFNAPSRETCIVKRENTNTPMQALNLMNDEQYVEAARVLAEKMMRNEKTSVAIIKSLGVRVLGHPISEQEQAKLSDTYLEFKEYFQDHIEEAKEFIKVGEYPLDEKLNAVELSAWTMLASTLMNRDDVVNKN